MTHKKHSVRSGILLTLILIIITAAIAAGVCFANARTVFADETPSTDAADEEVKPRANSWKTEPAISGWDYFQYDGKLIEGEATYGKVSYSVLNDDAARTYASEDLKSFASVDDVEEALNVLGRGDYILCAVVPEGTATEEVGEGDDKKEVSFEYAELKKEIKFSVARATNKWVEELTLTNTVSNENTWTYGSFSNSTHTISSKALCGDTVYTVRNANGDTVVGAFTLEEGGSVPATAIKAINLLTIGTYTLWAEVESTDNYTGLGEFVGGTHKQVSFTVVKATNRWINEPEVSGWGYGAFNTGFIRVNPACGADSMRLTVYELVKTESNGTVTYTVKGAVALGNTQSFFLEDGKIPRDIEIALNELGKGVYSLVAVVPETTSYTGLNENITALDGAIFEISGTTNTWSSTPNVIRWTWGSFSKSVNVFTAVPTYPWNAAEKKVSFGIYTDVSLDNPVAGLSNFTTVTGTAYGEQVGDDVARLLAALPAGTYYLNARSAQGESYNGLSSVIQFTVAEARNYWTSTPQIVQWTWSNYNPEVNVISATPAIGETENVVYGVYRDNNCNLPVTDLSQFSFTKTVDQTVIYQLPEEVEEALAKLGAGTYYLKAEVPGTGNYSTLGSVTEFTVQKVNNFWRTTPSMLSWKYGSYDKEVNAVNAEAAFGRAVISIYHEDGTQVLFSDNGTIVKEFSLQDGKVPEYVSGILNTLGKGSYYVLASVAGTDDYTGLNEYTMTEDIIAHGVGIVITANANAWLTVPRVLGWVEGGFDGEKNKIFAEAACGNDTMRITVLDSDGSVVATYTGADIDYGKLAKLDVGSYTVKFSIEGTGSYDGLSGETTFAVTEDAVGLTGIIAAVVVFGVFDIAAAAFCIYLVVSRRRKIEESFRNMIRKELHRR